MKSIRFSDRIVQKSWRKRKALLGKKEEAGRRILELESNIRATDIGSFKFVARAFDPEVARAEATENPILIKEAMDRAVNRWSSGLF